ncbi:MULTISPECIES: DUF6545 domain-containing protein [unclassified Streptomyces]|uniref:DUF6545 domain-containing protein n=1 Tax=unclassified Streptomyces TaxID=2593676 RepID=UPI002E2E0078|nr:DUF6545 domain-containing protein [Streptomyces sp. NBC_01439]
MEGSDYYIPAAILMGAFLLKGPVLVRRWRDPAVRAVSGLLFLGGVGFALAAPPTILVVNRAAGVPNFSAPLVYAVLSCSSAWCLVLLVHWMEGPGAEARRQVRWWSWVFAVVVTSIGAFFALGDAPVERLQDLDTHYASTPYIREMITVYLVWHFALWSAWRTYRLPGPLWRRFRVVDQPDSGPGTPKWWRPVDEHLVHRETDLQDWLRRLTLTPYWSRTIMTDTIEQASRTGMPTQHAWALGAATMIHHAIESAREAQHTHPAETLGTGIDSLTPILGADSHGMARVARQDRVLARYSTAA